MTQLQGPTAFFDVASILLTNLQVALTDVGSGSVERACVVPGQFAWDGCECGTLGITMTRFFLSDDFPTGAFGQGTIRSTPCNLPWIVGVLGVIVLRCAPQPVGQAVAPSCESLAGSAFNYARDAYAVMSETVATLCDLVQTDRIVDYIIGDQEQRGPEGSCVGTELTVSIAVMR